MAKHHFDRPFSTIAVIGFIACCFAGILWPLSLPVIANLLPLLGLMFFRSKLRFGVLSPIVVIVLILSLVGAVGFILADDLGNVGGGGIRIALDETTRSRTAYVYAITSLLILVSTLLVLSGGRDRTKISVRDFRIPDNVAPFYLLAALLPVAMVLMYLQGDFFLRDRYLAGVGGSNIFGLGQQVGIASVAIAGNVFGSKSKYLRVIAALVALVFIVLFFGLGSRRLALAPLAFALGFLLAKPKKILGALIPAAFLAIFLLPLPLYMRGLQEHGLIAYAAALESYKLFDTDWVVTLNNVLISFPITGATAFGSSSIPLSYLGVSLNPLPGVLAGWYDISSEMTLNRWTPFSAVGEAANYGMPWMAVVWVGVGILVGVIELLMVRVVRAGYPIAAIGAVGLVSLFAIQSIQYTMRSSTRMLFYALILLILVWIYSKWCDLIRSSSISGAPNRIALTQGEGANHYPAKRHG